MRTFWICIAFEGKRLRFRVRLFPSRVALARHAREQELGANWRRNSARAYYAEPRDDTWAGELGFVTSSLGASEIAHEALHAASFVWRRYFAPLRRYEREETLARLVEWITRHCARNVMRRLPLRP